MCTKCGENKKGDISSTGNFKRHYKTKHLSSFKELEDYTKATKHTSGSSTKSDGNRQTKMTEVIQNISPDSVLSIAILIERIIFKQF